jgi:hypothetical protein
VSAFVLQGLPYALRSLWGFRTFTRLNNAIFPLTHGDLVLHENRRWKFTCAPHSAGKLQEHALNWNVGYHYLPTKPRDQTVSQALTTISVLEIPSPGVHARLRDDKYPVALFDVFLHARPGHAYGFQ